MKSIKLNRLFTTLIIVVFSAGTILPQQDKTPVNSLTEKNVPLVELKGNGYERGIQHGTLLKNEIAELYKKWKDDLKRTTRRDADSVIAEFLKATNFEPIIKKLTPEVLDEVKGIAEGSKQKYDDVFAFQLVDEFWVYLDRLSNTKNHHCSGLGVPAVKNRPAIVAQNTDLPNLYNGYQTVFHIARTKTEPEQFIISTPGFVCINGMNENRVGVCVNTIMEATASADGLPVAYVIRGILSRQTGKEALSFLTTTKHASGQNYIVGIKDSVYNYEASANKVVRYLPKGTKSALVYHTNHAIVNDDIKEWYAEYHKRILGDGASRMDSGIRQLALEKRLSLPLEEITIDVVKTTLRSKDHQRSPVCRPYFERGGVFSFVSVIYVLGDKPSLQITNGPPDQAEYIEHFFSAK